MKPSSVLSCLAAAALLLCAGLAARRAAAAYAVTAVAPGTSVTSGYEEESFYAVWRAARGETVYLDPLERPFASAYFNWAFYRAYGLALRPWVPLADGTAVPRFGRLVTAAGALAGATVLALALARILPGRRWLVAALAAFAFAGPLVGWWAHTVRPDVWALAAESAALAGGLCWLRTRPTLAFAVAAAGFYTAWAFKPTYFLGLGAFVLFLLAERRFRFAAGLLGVLAAAVAVTLALGGPGYRLVLFGTAVTNRFFIGPGLAHLPGAVLKLAPLLLLALPGLLRPPAPGGNPLAADALRLARLGLPVLALFAFAGSCKLGAATNYYFSLVPLLALAAAASLAVRPLPRLAPAAFAGMCALQLGLFAGAAGRIDLRPQAEQLARRWQVFRALPEPRFSSDLRLNLPWLNPRTPPAMPAFNYPLDRAAGKRFAAGGIGGLISSGHFAGLLLEPGPNGAYDGASLAGFAASGRAEGLVAFVRRAEPPP